MNICAKSLAEMNADREPQFPRHISHENAKH